MTKPSTDNKAPETPASRASFIAVDLIELPRTSLRPLTKTNLDGNAAREIASETDLVPSLVAISKTMRALRGLRLATLGFDSGQDEFLMAIPEIGLEVSKIADALTVRPSTVSKMADRLLEKGLIERTRDANDARKTIIQITPAGAVAQKRVAALQAEMEAEFTKMMDADTLEARKECLRDCAEMIKVRLMRLR